MIASISRILFMGALIFTILICFGQNPGDEFSIQNDLHSLYQIEGTNASVKDFFARPDLEINDDTIYVVLLPPMGCPRCEGIINPFIKDLDKLKPGTEVYIIAFHPKPRAVKKYFETRRFLTSKLIACTDESFLDNFFLSSETLQVPYICKFSVLSGDLIFSKSSLGINYSKDLTSEFIAKCIPEKKIKKPVSKAQDSFIDGMAPEVILTSRTDTLPILKPWKKIILREDPDYPIGRISNPGFNVDFSRISFMNDLSSDIYLFDIDTDSAGFIRAVSPGDTENRLFIDPLIGDTLYWYLYQMNILNSMYFNSFIIGDSVLISSSLPYVFWENIEEEHLAYYNKITYLLNDIEKDILYRYFTIDTIFDNMTLDHQSSSYFPEDDALLIPLVKGWPQAGTEMQPMNDKENPFLEEFYDSCPLYAVFNASGKYQGTIGKLPPLFRKLKLGYTYCNAKIKIDKANILLTDSRSGLIQIYLKHDMLTPVKSISVFELPEFRSRIDYEQQAFDYITDYRKIFQPYIMDMSLINDHLAVIFKYGNMINLKIISLSDGDDQLVFLPNVYQESEIRNALFNKKRKEIICVYESPDDTGLLYFDLTDLLTTKLTP